MFKKVDKLLIITAIIVVVCSIVFITIKSGENKITAVAAKYLKRNATTTKDGRFEYIVLDDGTIEITDYLGSDKTLTIPSTIDGKNVTSIGEGAFTLATSMTSVKLPSGVTSIKSFAFDRCTNLISIDIPDSVTSIGNQAFDTCRSLKNIVIPDGVTDIGSGAFMGCQSIESISIPLGITSIEGYVFGRCDSLTSIDISANVIKINSNAFYECENLAYINIDSNNSEYSSINGVLFDKNKTKLIQYPDGKKESEYVIPDSVTTIKHAAFDDCINLKNITISSGVLYIESNAFDSCTNLININLPEGIKEINRMAFYCCSSLKSINIPSGVVEIGESAFSGCSSLTTINISEDVTNIGNEAFRGCNSLKNINVAENNQYYSSESGVLYNKDKTILIQYPISKADTQYIIPKGVKNLGNTSFAWCTNLININIPESLTTIGKGAFAGCSNLKSIVLPENLTSIGDAAFQNCTNLTDITVPAGIAQTGVSIFSYCSNLTNVTIIHGSKSIENSTFWMCESLKTIIIPDSVTNIASGAFYGASNLTIYCKGNSTAEAYAIAENISYVIDYDGPIFNNIEMTATTWSNEDVTLTITATDNCTGLPPKAYSFDGGRTWQTENTKTYNEYEKVVVQVRDSVGNVSEQNLEVLIDKQAPKVESITGNASEWTKDDVTLTINASDDLSGFSENSYSFDGGETWQVENIKTFAENTNGIVVKVKDQAGNETTYEETIEITKIDKVLPTIEGITGNLKEWTKGNVTLTINGQDSLSGLAEKPYSFDGGVTWQGENTKTFAENTNGIVVKVKDQAGNETTYEESIEITKIDKVSPRITSIEGNPTEWTKENVILTINAQDSMSGLAEKAYSFDGGETWQVENTKTYEENASGIVIQVRDTLGNIYAHEAIEITKIDKQAPTIINVEGNATEWTKENVTLIINAEDGLSGLPERPYSFDGGETWQAENTKIYTENATGIIIKIKDQAGNQTTYGETIEITQIDKQAPTITSIEGNVTEWTKGNVILTINAQDILSGLAERPYSFDGGATWQQSNSKTYTENTSGIVIKVKDKLDNIYTHETIEITKIDKQAPTITSVEGNPTEWTKENVTLTINAEDSLSGLAEMPYSFDGGETWQTENTKTYTENTTGIIIKVKDKLDNIATYDVINIDKICELEIKLDSYEEKQKENNTYITNVSPETTIGDFIENIDTNGTIEIYKGIEEITSTDTNIGTGMTVKITLNKEQKEYTVVIKGDINGDGKAKLSDLSKLKLSIVGTTQLEGAYKEAADINGDGDVKLSDLSKMKLYIVGKARL